MTKRLEYAVRVTLEEITYFEDDDGEWGEDTRTECLEDTIHQSIDHEENRERYKLILQKLRGKGRLMKKEGTRLITAMAHGFEKQLKDVIEEDGKIPVVDMDRPRIVEWLDYRTFMRNLVSEIAHSMNRKGLLSNDGTDKFIKLAYEEMKI